MCIVGLYVSLCLMIFLCSFLHCKALRTAMYKRYINSIVIIIIALKLVIYYDDVNTANPMTNKVHRLGLFYYQLVNIKSVYRGKLKSIQLFAICKKPYIKQFGLNEILEPLVDDLKELGSDSAYPFDIGGGIVYLRGCNPCRNS